MPLSFLTGIGDPSTVRGLEWLSDRSGGGTPLLSPERLAYVGLRDVDVYERKILHHLQREHGLFTATMQDVDRMGIGRVMELALAALGVSGPADGTNAPLHLSFDIDSVDPQVRRDERSRSIIVPYMVHSPDLNVTILSCRFTLDKALCVPVRFRTIRLQYRVTFRTTLLAHLTSCPFSFV